MSFERKEGNTYIIDKTVVANVEGDVDFIDLALEQNAIAEVKDSSGKTVWKRDS